jgi:hypothetical protein
MRITDWQAESKANYCAQGKVSPGLRILESGAVSLLRETEGEASELLHTVSAQPSECVLLDELAILVKQIQPHVLMARTNCTIWTLPRAAFQNAVLRHTANQGPSVSTEPLQTVSGKSPELQRELGVPLLPTASKANVSIGFPVLFCPLFSTAQKSSLCMQSQVYGPHAQYCELYVTTIACVKLTLRAQIMQAAVLSFCSKKDYIKIVTSLAAVNCSDAVSVPLCVQRWEGQRPANRRLFVQWDALQQLAILCTQPLFEVRMMKHIHSGHSCLVRVYFMEAAKRVGLSVELSQRLQLTKTLACNPWFPEPRARLESAGSMLEQLHVDGVCALDDLLAEGPLSDEAARFLLANAVVICLLLLYGNFFCSLVVIVSFHTATRICSLAVLPAWTTWRGILMVNRIPQ